MSINPDEIISYLKDHLEFFEQYADDLAEIYIPHPHGGRAIPLSERQILTLREKNKVLETKLRRLIQFGEENDAISDKMHAFTLALLRARSLDSLAQSIELELRETFDVPHATLRLWGVPEGGALASQPEAGEEVRAYGDSLSGPSCSPQFPVAPQFFGEAAPLLQSFAIIPVRGEKVTGLLVLASEDAQRFSPEVGTLYLRRLAELVATALSHQIEGQ